MKSIVDRLLGENSGYAVRKHIYLSTLLAGVLLTFVGGLMNLILGLNPFSYIMPFLSLVVFVAFYLYTRKRELSDISYRLGLGFTVLVFYPIFSFINGAFSGGFHYFFAFFWVLAVAVLPGKNKRFLLAYAFVVFVVLGVDYFYPELAASYENRTVQYIDIAISIVLLLGGMYVILNIVMRAYDAANASLETKNIELEDLSAQLTKNNLALEDINQSKDKFFSIIAHDLRGAFNSMLGFSDLLKSRYDNLSEEQKMKYLDLINANIHKTYDFFENLLEWSRAQRGAIEVNPMRVSVFLLVEEVLGVLSLMADKKEVHLEADLPDYIYYDLDKHIFVTVLRNLISNALKYTPHHGCVKVGAEINAEGALVVAVIDNGVGMSDQDLANLFQLSENKSRKGTDNEPGTGLGLILCKELVEKHGGTIEVKSKLNEGSVFSFEIPSYNTETKKGN